MIIFQHLLEKRYMTLHDLQICWEHTHKNLRFCEHKDLLKVVVILKYITRDKSEEVKAEVDETLFEPSVRTDENSDIFMRRMQKISKRLQRLKDAS